MVNIKEILKQLEKIPKEEQIQYLEGFVKIIDDKKLIKQIEEVIEKLKKEVKQTQEEPKPIQQVETPIRSEPLDVGLELKYEPKDEPLIQGFSSELEQTVRASPVSERAQETIEYTRPDEGEYTSNFERLEEDLEIDSLDKISTEFEVIPRESRPERHQSQQYVPVQERRGRFVRPEDLKKYETRTNILPADTQGLIDWEKEREKYYAPIKKVHVK